MIKTGELYLQGQILLIDKPLEWSSFQAVNAIKWALRTKFGLKKIKVGHAGTLDPLATGLLLICSGKATKKISELQSQPKEYTGTLYLGATTPSYDLETPVDRTFPTAHIDESLLRTAAGELTGLLHQYPPVFSAIKKDGRRLYEFARSGEKVSIQARPVEVLTFELTAIKVPEVSFRVRCGKGTYIRSLVHDFGRKLGSGAHLTELRRTKIGEYNVNIAVTPMKFRELLFEEAP